MCGFVFHLFLGAFVCLYPGGWISGCGVSLTRFSFPVLANPGKPQALRPEVGPGPGLPSLGIWAWARRCGENPAGKAWACRVACEARNSAQGRRAARAHSALCWPRCVLQPPLAPTVGENPPFRPRSLLSFRAHRGILLGHSPTGSLTGAEFLLLFPTTPSSCLASFLPYFSFPS